MRATHTPGPWFIHERFSSDGTFDIWDKPDALRGARWLADVKTYGGAFPDVPEAEANARLIAAAPELLAACKEFVRKCDDGEAKSRRSYAEMSAAIAKAEGRSE